MLFALYQLIPSFRLMPSGIAAAIHCALQSHSYLGFSKLEINTAAPSLAHWSFLCSLSFDMYCTSLLYTSTCP